MPGCPLHCMSHVTTNKKRRIRVYVESEDEFYFEYPKLGICLAAACTSLHEQSWHVANQNRSH
jgi:hypothetical protein